MKKYLIFAIGFVVLFLLFEFTLGFFITFMLPAPDVRIMESEWFITTRSVDDWYSRKFLFV